MITDNLKVGLLTDHVALKDIASVITPELIESKINTISKTLKQDFRVQNRGQSEFVLPPRRHIQVSGWWKTNLSSGKLVEDGGNDKPNVS